MCSRRHIPAYFAVEEAGLVVFCMAFVTFVLQHGLFLLLYARRQRQ